MADLDSTMPVTVLLNGYQVKIEAVDPVSGAPVSGVALSDVSISGLNLAGGVNPTAPEPPPNVLGAYLPPADAGNPGA